MEQQIPIIVTKKKRQYGEPAFQVLNIQQTKDYKHRRQKTTSRKDHQDIQSMPKHQTLDNDKQFKPSSRTKRISSSGASKRFPKDFFKNENCPMTSKPQKGKSKPIQITDFIETFNQSQYQKVIIKEQQNEFLVKPQMGQIKQQNEGSRVETPKFKNKFDAQSTTKIVESGNKVKIQDYLSHKKFQEVNLSSNVETVYKSNFHILKNSLISNSKFNQQQPKKDALELQPISPLVSNFNMTLGKKNSLIFLMRKEQQEKKKKPNLNIIDKNDEKNIKELIKKEEKENNYQAKKSAPPNNLKLWLWQKQMKLQAGGGFRIRKHVPN